MTSHLKFLSSLHHRIVQNVSFLNYFNVTSLLVKLLESGSE